MIFLTTLLQTLAMQQTVRNMIEQRVSLLTVYLPYDANWLCGDCR